MNENNIPDDDEDIRQLTEEEEAEILANELAQATELISKAITIASESSDWQYVLSNALGRALASHRNDLKERGFDRAHWIKVLFEGALEIYGKGRILQFPNLPRS